MYDTPAFAAPPTPATAHPGPQPAAWTADAGPRPQPPGAALLAALLDAFDTGAILCDADGRLLLANHAARQQLVSDGPLRVAGSQLHCAQPVRLRAALHAAARQRRRQLLVLAEGNEQLLIYVQPMVSPCAGGDCVALMLGRRVDCQLAIETMAGLFQLTGSERQVLQALVGGKRVNDIARERGVAVCTVRSQIQAIRNKTGSDSICAMLALVTQLPPITPALRQSVAAPRELQAA